MTEPEEIDPHLLHHGHFLPHHLLSHGRSHPCMVFMPVGAPEEQPLTIQVKRTVLLKVEIPDTKLLPHFFRTSGG